MPVGFREATEVGNTKGLPWYTHNPCIRDRCSQLQITVAPGGLWVLVWQDLIPSPTPAKVSRCQDVFIKFAQFLKP